MSWTALVAGAGTGSRVLRGIGTDLTRTGGVSDQRWVQIGSGSNSKCAALLSLRRWVRHASITCLASHARWAWTLGRLSSEIAKACCRRLAGFQRQCERKPPWYYQYLLNRADEARVSRGQGRFRRVARQRRIHRKHQASTRDGVQTPGSRSQRQIEGKPRFPGGRGPIAAAISIFGDPCPAGRAHVEARAPL